MNIGLFTDTYYPELNGVATSTYLLKKELEKQGHRVYVFTVSNPNMTEEETDVIRIKSLPFALLKDRRFGFARLFHWTTKIEKLELDVIHTQTEFTLGHMGFIASRRLGIPHVHTYHTVYEDYTHYLKIPGNSNLKGIVRSMSKEFCNHANVVIVPTEKVKNLLIQYGVTKDIEVQPTGIELNKFGDFTKENVDYLRKQYGIMSDDHILVSVGRLAKEKNVSSIIDYVKELAAKDEHVKLIVVGGGPEAKNLEKQVEELGLSDVVMFTGEVQWKDVQEYYALGDVFVSGSTSETQGLTYFEALSCGKPLLVRDDDCLEDVIKPGENGYAFTNKIEFEDSYFKLFDNENYKTMNDNAKDTAKQYSSESFGDNVEQIYRRLIGEK